MAAMRGHVRVLEALLMPPDATHAAAADVDEPSADGSTPLIHVASNVEQLPANSQVAMLRWLVGAAAAVEASTEDGTTALLAAAANGQVDAVIFLAEEGRAKLEVRGGAEGTNAIELATRRGDVPTVKALLAAGALPTANALELAVARREHELIKLLSSAAS